MAIKNPVGRPPVITMKEVNKLADLIAHNYNVSDSCKFTRISRSTFYQYLKTEPIFKEQIEKAKDNQNRVSFDFRTYP